MFNALRNQTRSSVLTAARAAAPATRSISSLVSRRVMVPAVMARSVSRPFSQSAPAMEFIRERQNNPPSDSIYIGNLPWSATKEELQELFSEFGEVSSIRIQTHADGRPKGYAHLNFATKEGAIAAVTSATEEPLHFGGRDLIIDYAKSLGQAQADAAPSSKLYFARFADSEPALRELMSKYADDIVQIYFMRDGNTGASLQAGFVEFTDTPTATEVLNELNGASTPSGEPLLLAYARPKKPRNENSRRFDSGGNNRFQKRNTSESYTARSWNRNRE